MSQTVNRKALLICSPFFGYYKHIIHHLNREGYAVDYRNDRPSENAFVKGLIKINPKSLTPVIRNYYEKILSEASATTYDLILVINNKVMSEDVIKRLKSNQTKARFVFYTWDSIELYPQALKVIRLFDVAYSFDIEDCKKYSDLKHLPLFYTDLYANVGSAPSLKAYQDRPYDIVSVCTAHPNRYRILKELLPKLESSGIKVYSYLFIELLQYIYNKFRVKEFKKAHMSEFNTKKLSEKDVIRLFETTRSILDIQHASQSGLTMRTLETLGAKRKLITYNQSIRNYDFYNENNIYILDDNNWLGISAFLSKDFEEIDEAIYQKYSIRSWIRQITGCQEEK